MAGTLSGGEQQMLALARVFALRPKAIIADETSMGLAPKVTDEVFETLEAVAHEGITLILMEQFIERALKMATDCIILRRGAICWAGDVSEARKEVIDRYLGDVESE
jgi:branched-chain amino acid transport system ATP-binding protein